LDIRRRERIKSLDYIALKAVQKKHPSYNKGAENWWRDVIRGTALGAGGNERGELESLMTVFSALTFIAVFSEVDLHLSEIVKKLMKRFSSKEGYCPFDDAIPTR
jgi:hypothetical protein